MRKAILLLIPLLIFAQNYVLKKDVLSSGGRKMTSTDYILQGTISQTAIGAVTDTDYEGVIGFWHPPEPFPPNAPYIYVMKSGSDAVLTWNMITTDTLGNPETMHYYIVYRSTDPSFIPGNSDSIGISIQPETTYTDAGVNSISSPNYYYLVKAVDVARNMSDKSNMGYKFNKAYVTSSTSNRNWTSLPWHNEYTTISDLTTELSPSGDPLEEITNLRNDQLYESWVYDMFFGWFGTNFTVANGRGYEMVTTNDTSLVLVGSNNPNGQITLVTSGTSNRNWVSIPYNASYSTISDVTTEYSPSGDPLEEITNLRNDQLYESWVYDMFFGWFGTNFAVIPGRGYEFVTINDTVWDPTEYSNRFTDRIVAGKAKEQNICSCRIGDLKDPDRSPIWEYKPEDHMTSAMSHMPTADADDYVPVASGKQTTTELRDVGISHIVFGKIDLHDAKTIAFTAYRPDVPYDVLTENTIGCGIVEKSGKYGYWFNTGNFKRPWKDGEQVIVIIEAATANNAYFDVFRVTLDKGSDVQRITQAYLEPVPEIRDQEKSIAWEPSTKHDVIGYSAYDGVKRLNDRIIENSEIASQEGVIILRPVITGGYETVLTPTGVEEQPQSLTPIAYAFKVFPNPFVSQTGVNYALPQKTQVDIKVYDVSGRAVRTLLSSTNEPGVYTVNWNGVDDMGRSTAAGVYFIQIITENYQSQQKVILVR